MADSPDIICIILGIVLVSLTSLEQELQTVV
jgi:hypothetical protein